jgi:hypothetical protein
VSIAIQSFKIMVLFNCHNYPLRWILAPFQVRVNFSHVTRSLEVIYVFPVMLCESINIPVFSIFLFISLSADLLTNDQELTNVSPGTTSAGAGEQKPCLSSPVDLIRKSSPFWGFLPLPHGPEL